MAKKKFEFEWDALPDDRNFPPEFFQKRGTVVLLFCHTPLLGTAVGIRPKLQTVPSIVTGLPFVTTPFPANPNNWPAAY